MIQNITKRPSQYPRKSVRNISQYSDLNLISDAWQYMKAYSLPPGAIHLTCDMLQALDCKSSLINHILRNVYLMILNINIL